MPRLENWSIIVGTDSPYQAPELGKNRLWGEIYDDTRFPDGTRICTSPIKSIYEDHIITAGGSMYTLGQVDPEYEKLFPGARDRVLRQANSRREESCKD